ncbi:RDD family protein [Hymenobacter sp. GOD-10R]|uniref:RDD family protein n=1 Tax=Hymenobacter sp. GOD-10R TaxID=3093922 RepID=UPI002D79A25E|nr:RDD family protein [Hymenobacter sp. GOD-10R]WRQ29849.1 RDD family protein [Hymenobacter sp. GOD-10R]
MATIRIQTTQNVTIEYEVASIGDRIISTILDYLVLFVWAVVVIGLGSWLSRTTLPWVAIALVGVPYVFYHLICEVFFNGQSLGKRARDLKVVRLDGGRPSLGDYLLRWLLRLIDLGIFSGAVAVVTILLNGRGQRLGDLAAGTTVVRLRPAAGNKLGTNLGPPDPNYQVVFPQAANLADHDVALIRQLLAQGLERQNYLLLNEVANKVKGLTGIYTTLSDEAFLRTLLRDHAHLASEGYYG